MGTCYYPPFLNSIWRNLPPNDTMHYHSVPTVYVWRAYILGTSHEAT